MVTATPIPNSTPTILFVITATQTTATMTPPPTFTPTLTPIYDPPILFDPPDGAKLATNSAQLQWRWDRELGSNEEFEVVVTVEGGSKRNIKTREKKVSIDFPVHFGNASGKFTWSVQVKRTDGVTLNRPGTIFVFERRPKEKEPPPRPPYP